MEDLVRKYKFLSFFLFQLDIRVIINLYMLIYINYKKLIFYYAKGVSCKIVLQIGHVEKYM